MAEAGENELIYRLFTEIGIIEQLGRNRLERGLPDGLKVSQFGVLNHLARLGGAWAPARLAAAFQVTKGAMTNTLGRLETRGLVKVNADPDDGRAKLVTLTPAGRKMHARCLDGIMPVFADLMDEVSAADFATALPVLEKIRKFLDSNRP